MFDLVNDVEAYQHFLPACTESRILHLEADQLTARLILSAGGISQSFTTLNRLHRPEQIDMQLVEGPFKYLKGSWRFIEAQQEGSIVHLQLDFECSNRLLSLMLDPVLSKTTHRVMHAFKKRAQDRYGRPMNHS